MSRIGKQPVKVPAGVKVSIQGRRVEIEGKLGKLACEARAEVSLAFDEKAREVRVARHVETRLGRSVHGLTRALLQNMVTGVTEGYTKKLEIVGVGYRVLPKGPTQLEFQLGYSHPIIFDAPEGITFTVEGPTKLGVVGIDKQLVGEVAAKIRKLRKPEPYKGKGVRYAGEHIRRKVGKAGK